MDKTVGRAVIAIAAGICLVGATRNANADDILDTGTPTGSSELVLSTSQSFAAEFSIQAGQTVDDLSAYINLSAGNNAAFEFEIFSNSPAFIGNRNLTSLYSVAETAGASAGWSTDSTAVAWTPTTSGDYWLVLLAPNTGSTFDVQTLTSATTGSVPALEFAATNTPGSRYAQLNSGIGLEVSTVPLPAAAWLMLSGLGGIGAMVRKRKTA